ncbi:MAG: glycosyltransferase family 2 protein [Coriobacteriia bacterium]|nr:glycosyltransferase family 2 protein [Coriobacteriia bacterium]
MIDAILMPVYNEAETVCAVLDSVRIHFDGELFVVDDGSTDGTVSLLAGRDDVTVITHPQNLGYGRALAEGFAVARAREVNRLITMDCDGQHEPAHIPQFLRALTATGADIVSGSRYLPESAKIGAAPDSRREINARVTAEVNRVTGWDITDAFCGFKAYRLAALDGMSLCEPGYALPLELWAKAYRKGLVVRELPVERIYFDHDRTFGHELDDPEKRYAYYMKVWSGTLAGEECP